MLGDHNQVEVVAKGGNVVARTDLADNQYSSADPRLVLFNTIAGEGKTPLAKNFNAAFNDPQSPWIQLFRSAVFEDADDAAIDQGNAAITSVLQGNEQDRHRSCERHSAGPLLGPALCHHPFA